MPLSQALLSSLAPRSIIDHEAEATDTRLRQQASSLNIQSAQDEAAGKRRAMAVSMLNGLQQETDPEKQAALYSTLKPMAERYDPTLKLPDAYDPSLSKALTASQMSPSQPQTMTPYQEAQITALNERNAINREKMSAVKTGKALSMPGMKDLEGKAKGYEDMTRLSTGFTDDFAGNTFTGALENFAGRLGGENIGLTDPGQTQWWQDYQGYVNQVRNDLFGAALTATEKAEFEKAIVMPGMDPQQAHLNLQRQQAITQKALARAGNVYRKGGYNAEQISEYVPDGLASPDTTDPALGSNGTHPLVSTQEEYDALPSGTLYMEDDGKLYAKP
jgi:hypothetical protein